MKKDIIIAGVGGQGIVSIAAVIGYAAVSSDLYIKASEVHGMSMRGGEVQSHLRISDREIFSDLIPHGRADLIISMEPMEGLRYLPYLSMDGWLITNSRAYINIPNYPPIEKLLWEIESIPRHILLDADGIAGKYASHRSANMVVLGAAAPFLGFSDTQLEYGIKTLFERKGERAVAQNLKAFSAGKEFSAAACFNLPGKKTVTTESFQHS